MIHLPDIYARGVLRKKRDGGVPTREEYAGFLSAAASGDVDEALVGAMCAVIFLRGMETDELFDFTHGMLASGVVLAEPGTKGRVDKHSTGGVGDKASLPLAPALAALGLQVPMISGRGLGHTGGTLDKLEAIEGFDVELSLAQIEHVLDAAGCVICAQTGSLVPADRVLYAVRDRTEMVESLPLIASSIVSKKLAEGIEALVLDVKFGSGAFLGDREAGAELGRVMRSIGESFGVRTSIVQTSMDSPLGVHVGHSLEVFESLECLHGRGPADLREVVVTLGAELVLSTGRAATLELARAEIERVLDSGEALERFALMVAAQGGDATICEAPERLVYELPRAELLAERPGFVTCRDTRSIGHACACLGGGRMGNERLVDHRVGIEVLVKPGDEVAEGQPLVCLHHEQKGVEHATALLREALPILDEPPEVAPLVLPRADDLPAPA